MLTSQYRILLVDDEETILFALGSYFETLGYQVDCARESAEAVALISSLDYAVAVVDLRLTEAHELEGLKITSAIKALRPATQVIVLTAHGTEEVTREARRRGAVAVLPKPQPLSTLAAMVEGLITGSRIEQVMIERRL